MVIKIRNFLLAIVLLTTLGVSFAEEVVHTKPLTDAQQPVANQLARGFLIGAVLIDATTEYYRFNKECPANLAALTFPTMQDLNKVGEVIEVIDLKVYPVSDLLLVDELTVNKQCQITIRFKDKAPVFAELRGKIITVKLAMADDLATASCSFDGDQAYAPPSNCQFPASESSRLSPLDMKMAIDVAGLHQWLRQEVIKKHISTIGWVENCLAPLKQAVYSYYQQNKQCPSDDKNFANTINEVKNSYMAKDIANIALKGCQIEVTLVDKEELGEYIRGKTILFDMAKDSDDWRCSVPHVNRFMLPNYCLQEP